MRFDGMEQQWTHLTELAKNKLPIELHKKLEEKARETLNKHFEGCEIKNVISFHAGMVRKLEDENPCRRTNIIPFKREPSNPQEPRPVEIRDLKPLTEEERLRGKEELSKITSELLDKLKALDDLKPFSGRLVDEKEGAGALRYWHEHINLCRKERETGGCYWMGRLKV